MGNNTTVVVLNDALELIRDDPEFGRKLYQAITCGEYPGDVSAQSGNSVPVNAAVVIETHPAEHEVLIKVGRNIGSVVSNEDGIIRDRRSNRFWRNWMRSQSNIYRGFDEL